LFRDAPDLSIEVDFPRMTQHEWNIRIESKSFEITVAVNISVGFKLPNAGFRFRPWSPPAWVIVAIAVPIAGNWRIKLAQVKVLTVTDYGECETAGFADAEMSRFCNQQSW